MAFFSKVGNILKQNVSKNLRSELSSSNPSLLQAIRCMSSSKLFIGGLSYNTDDSSLRDAFASHGEVIEARVIMDRETGRSRGFGFVSFTSTEEASSAIQAMDGQDLHGRRVRVNYATERAGGGFRSGGGGYGGGGGYNGGGGYSGGGGGYNGGGGYSGGGGGGGYGGGGYSGGGGGYGSGGGYGGGVDSYGSGGNTFGGGYGDGNGTNAAAAGGGFGYGGNSSGNFSVAGGGGGSENFASGGAGGDNTFASGGYTGSTGASYGQDDPLEGNFKDDNDEADDYANRRV